MDIDQEIDEMQTALDALRDKAEKQKKSLVIAGSYVSEPAENAYVYVILGCGSVRQKNWRENNDCRGYFSQGNCYKTREAAEYYLERAKVVQELWQCEGACEWAPGCRGIYFDADVSAWNAAEWQNMNSPTDLPFFWGDSKSQAAIDKLGSRLHVLRGYVR